MLQEHISTAQWLTIPQPIRMRLVEIFKIPRSAYTVVEDNTVTSDGYMTEDLFTITKEKCQEYLDRTDEGDTLLSTFGMVVKMVQEELEPIEDAASLGEPVPEPVKDEIINAKPKKSNVRKITKTQ